MTQKNNLFKAVRPIMEIQHQEYLTFSKAAILMGCSRQYIYKLVAMGKLKASRISNRMAFIRRARQHFHTEKIRFIFLSGQKRKKGKGRR